MALALEAPAEGAGLFECPSCSRTATPAVRIRTPACSTPRPGRHRTCVACPPYSRAPVRRKPGAALLPGRQCSLQFHIRAKAEDDRPPGSSSNVFVILDHWLQKDHSLYKQSIELERMFCFESRSARPPELRAQAVAHITERQRVVDRHRQGFVETQASGQ